MYLFCRITLFCLARDACPSVENNENIFPLIFGEQLMNLFKVFLTGFHKNLSSRFYFFCVDKAHIACHAPVFIFETHDLLYMSNTFNYKSRLDK